MCVTIYIYNVFSSVVRCEINISGWVAVFIRYNYHLSKSTFTDGIYQTLKYVSKFQLQQFFNKYEISNNYEILIRVLYYQNLTKPLFHQKPINPTHHIFKILKLFLSLIIKFLSTFSFSIIFHQLLSPSISFCKSQLTTATTVNLYKHTSISTNLCQKLPTLVNFS